MKIPNGGYCPYVDKEISLGECMDYVVEVNGNMKKNLILEIIKKKNITIETMQKICNKCDNYPFER